MENFQGNAEKKPQTLFEFVRHQIWVRIITHRYPPGYPLREEELQAEFGASRGPVREGLRMLLQSGLVEYASRKGFRVTRYELKEIIDVYELRAHLEGMVMLDLQRHNAKPMIKDLEAGIQVLQEYARRGDLTKYFFENIKFHDVIMNACQNRPLVRSACFVNEISLPTRYLLIQKEGSLDRSMAGHRQLLELLRDEDFNSACNFMRSEIMENMKKVVAMLK